jgi:transcriptional regulator with XRE-family HTH domain
MMRSRQPQYEAQERRRAATQMRHEAMRVAVRALRLRVGWTQEKLAASVDKALGKKRVTQHTTISKWELGIDGPSPSHRMALAKIAAKHNCEDLAAAFREANLDRERTPAGRNPDHC